MALLISDIFRLEFIVLKYRITRQWNLYFHCLLSNWIVNEITEMLDVDLFCCDIFN